MHLSWSWARGRRVVGLVVVLLAAAFVVCTVQRYGYHSRHMSPAGSTPATPLERVVGWTALWGAAVWVLAAVGGLRRPPEAREALGIPARAAVVAGSSAVLTVVAVAQRLLVHQDSTGTLDAITNLTPLDVLLGVVTLVASTAAVVLLTCEHARTRTQTAP